MLFDRSIHKEDDNHRFVSKGQEMITVLREEHRMKFGVSKIFDPSGEINLTHGIKKQIHGKVKFDQNRQPRYIARKKHSCTIQHTLCSLYVGVNSAN